MCPRVCVCLRVLLLKHAFLSISENSPGARQMAVLCRPTFERGLGAATSFCRASFKMKMQIPCSKMVKNFTTLVPGHLAKCAALLTAEPVRPHRSHILEASPEWEACTCGTHILTPPIRPGRRLLCILKPYGSKLALRRHFSRYRTVGRDRGSEGFEVKCGFKWWPCHLLLCDLSKFTSLNLSFFSSVGLFSTS